MLPGASAGQGNVNATRADDTWYDTGVDTHQETAPATVDVDPGEFEDTGFDKNRQGLFGAERAGASHQKTGMTLSNFWLAGLDLLAADLTGELFGGHFAVAVHEYQQGFGFLVLEDQCLDDRVFVYAQFACRDARAAVLFVSVGMERECHLLCFEELRGRGL